MADDSLESHALGEIRSASSGHDAARSPHWDEYSGKPGQVRGVSSVAALRRDFPEGSTPSDGLPRYIRGWRLVLLLLAYDMLLP